MARKFEIYLNQYISQNQKTSIAYKEMETKGFDNYKAAEQKEDETLNKAVTECIEYLSQHENIDYKDFIETEINTVIDGKAHVAKLYFIIHVIWKKPDKNLSTIVRKVILHLLNLNEYVETQDYYVESFVEIWGHDFETLIPIDIIEQILLKESTGGNPVYGALIKASAYLWTHPKGEQEKLRAIIRKTERYKNDEYFRDWIK
jgi:hypothetical protein